MIDVPETRYTRAPDGAYIAFQVFGSGPIDVLLMPGFFTNLDEDWRIPEIADTHRRIGAFARVSRTVKDLVAGSGLVFEDAGEHELNGVPDRWHLYRVVDIG